MKQISISAIPNQTLTTSIDDQTFAITLRSIESDIVASISLDGVTLVQNVRVVTDAPIIPYKYLESGNFFISTENDEIPNWEQFGTTQFLFYVSADELLEARNAI